MQERSDYLHHAMNSLIIVGRLDPGRAADRDPGRLGHGVRADASAPSDTLMWMLSTKMMPPVGVLVPIYLIFRDFGLLDTRIGLIVDPVPRSTCRSSIWMLFTYFKEIPKRHPGSGAHGRRHGCARRSSIVLAPMAVPGIASTVLLNVILAWNEAFWTLNLTTVERGAADRVHRLLFEPGRAVLGQAVGRLDARPSRRSWCSAGSARSSSSAA